MDTHNYDSDFKAICVHGENVTDFLCTDCLIEELNEKSIAIDQIHHTLTKFMKFFKSGNDIPVERATITVANTPEIKQIFDWLEKN